MPAVLQIKPERISVWMRQGGCGLMVYSDCLRQHHAENPMLYREHNKHSKVKGLIPSHTLKSFFYISSANQLLSDGWSRHTAAWLEILAVEVGQVPLTYSPLILIGLGKCISHLVGGKLKCTCTKDYTYYVCMSAWDCVYMFERDRVKERLRHPTVKKKSLWAFGCSAGEDKTVWCLLTWPMIHNWGRTAVAGCTDRPQGEWQMIGPSGAELSISPNVHCLLSSYLYFL